MEIFISFWFESFPNVQLMVLGQSQTGPTGYWNLTSNVRAHWPSHRGLLFISVWQAAHSNRQVSPAGPHSQNLLQSAREAAIKFCSGR